jgi:hypothetical protein
MQFFTLAILFFIGIWLTGFENAHWFLWVPVVLMVFAGLTGICPGLMLWKKVGLK